MHHAIRPACSSTCSIESVRECSEILYLVIIVETYECESRVFLAWVIVAAPSCHSAGGGASASAATRMRSRSRDIQSYCTFRTMWLISAKRRGVTPNPEKAEKIAPYHM